MRRIDLENNSERFVAGKNDIIEPREKARYEYASRFCDIDKRVLDIGCSSGYGSRMLNHTDYTGVDYDASVIDYAKQEFPQQSFFQHDITSDDFEDFLRIGKFDVIIAFEILEHVDNGREIAQMLKQYCTTLICSTPFNETPGFWGEHHKLHRLTEQDFPNFNHKFMDWNGIITERPTNDTVIMVMDWKTPFAVPQKKKYTIVIPTYNHLEDCLKPCLESVLANTKLDDVEILIILNGCTDGTWEYLGEIEEQYDCIDTLVFSEAMGYTRAANRGIEEAQGEYIVLLNNDTVIQPNPISWLEMLIKPFEENPKCGQTGTNKAKNHVHGLEDFIIGYCSMVSREVINRVGLMDEQFSPGGMDDVDLSIRIQRAGYEIFQVPTDVRSYDEHGNLLTNFPLYHPGRSSTMHDLGNWQEIFDANIEKLRVKWQKPDHVLAEICTKNRYYTTLPQAVVAVAMQTRKVDKLIIYDDSDEKKDLRENAHWKNIFSMLDAKGMDWEWIYASGKGQHINHEDAQNRAVNFVWRIDDDTIPEPDTLERLLVYMRDPRVGAVGGKIFTPPIAQLNTVASNKLKDIHLSPNVQWFDFKEVIEVEHLHCSFLYRKGIAHYDMRLSPVAHREETMFTYEIFKAGWKVLAVPDATTWHLRNPEGGIRTYTNGEYWASDERIFSQKLIEWKVSTSDKHIIYCNLGLGDHFVLREALPAIIAKRGAENLLIVCHHSAVFEGMGVQCISEAESKSLTIAENVENVYGWCWKMNWKSSLLDAFKEQNT